MPTQNTTDKREQLVNNALTLFYQKGIHAVGINEVLKVSGIAKKTLYHHFLGKNALIEACVIERDKRFMSFIKSNCSNNKSAELFITQFFTALDNWINNRVPELGNFKGCFFVNTSAEFGDVESVIYQRCLKHKQTIKYFIEQQLAGHVTNDQQITVIVNMLVLLKEGVINSAYVMGDKQAALKAQGIALAFLKNLN